MPQGSACEYMGVRCPRCLSPCSHLNRLREGDERACVSRICTRMSTAVVCRISPNSGGALRGQFAPKLLSDRPQHMKRHASLRHFRQGLAAACSLLVAVAPAEGAERLLELINEYGLASDVWRRAIRGSRPACP